MIARVSKAKPAPIVAVIGLCLFPALLAGYKAKEIKVQPALEYDARQDFQNIVISAYPSETKGKTLELFDTDKLHEKGVLPVLIVVENNNDFAVRIHEEDIVLVGGEEGHASTIPYSEVLLHITLKEGRSSYSTRPEMLIKKKVDRKMVIDFEHKAFGEKLIAPNSSDYGVVFFWLPKGGNLAGMRLYFPEVFNLTKGESLVFFEFEVMGTKK